MRCPQCRRGQVFQSGLTMNEVCPVCGLRFGREPGYFLGAMYISYPLSVILLGLWMLLLHLLWPELRLEFVTLLALLLYLPFVPAVFRYSRVLWIYFDRWASPSGQ
jgi:uncharacterized protein (DUF983 family)